MNRATQVLLVVVAAIAVIGSAVAFFWFRQSIGIWYKPVLIIAGVAIALTIGAVKAYQASKERAGDAEDES